MRITSARVTMIDDPRLKALVSLVLDHCFVIHGFQIVEVDGLPFVVMPTIAGRAGRPLGQVVPADSPMRDLIHDAVLQIYLNGGGGEPVPVPAPLAPRTPSLFATAARDLPVPAMDDDAVAWCAPQCR
jgi:stage V sporulation protein G